jgi:hypothetical protein
MGLDLVEYVIAIEDAFEIEIPDANAARLETPGSVIDYLCARLGESPDGPPLRQTAFYWLRRGIIDELGVSRAQVRPATRIQELTTRKENDIWRAVARRLDVNAKTLTHAPVAQWLAKLVRAPGRTIGDVAEQLAMLRPVALKRSPARWTRAQITEVTLRLLEHEVGVTVGPSDLQSSFVRDLGMG